MYIVVNHIMILHEHESALKKLIETTINDRKC